MWGIEEMGACVEEYTGHNRAGGPVETACKEHHKQGRG